MGPRQDCWVWTADGGRLRACTTPVTEGMSIVTRGAVAEPTANLCRAGPATRRRGLVAAELRPLVVDEGRQSGGQIYRHQPENFAANRPNLRLRGAKGEVAAPHLRRAAPAHRVPAGNAGLNVCDECAAPIA